MTGVLRVGCAMWANRDWIGRHYRPNTKAGDELEQYAHWCTAVEGNTTFYALPPAATIRRWAEATPPSFRFVFKLPKTVTHEHRLRDVDAAVTGFVRLLEPLGERLGPVSVQLPPSFGPGDLGVLAAFLRRAPHEVRWAVEVRHPQFFDGGKAHLALDRVIADSGAERIVFDTHALFASPPTDDVERAAWDSKPRVPPLYEAFSDSPVVRYIGRTDEAETIAGWRSWLPVLAGWLAEGRNPTVFVHTPDNVAALALARRLHADVRAAVAGLDPLPAVVVPRFAPVQRSLFD